MSATKYSDDRWGDYLPWFFRHADFGGTGNFDLFYERVSQRLQRLFEFDEAGLKNMPHFGQLLESKSLQRFRYDRKKSLHDQIACFFDPEHMRSEAHMLNLKDQKSREFFQGLSPTAGSYGNLSAKNDTDEPKTLKLAIIHEKEASLHRIETHFRALSIQRLGVLKHFFASFL